MSIFQSEFFISASDGGVISGTMGGFHGEVIMPGATSRRLELFSDVGIQRVRSSVTRNDDVE